MPAPRKYPQEFKERSVRLVREAMSHESSLSMNAAVIRIGHRVGVNPDTLRGWVKQARIDAGEVAGVTTTDAATIKARKAREYGIPVVGEGALSD